MKTRSEIAACLALMMVLVVITPLVGATGMDDGEIAPRDASGRNDYMRFISLNGFEFDPLQGTPDIPDALRFDSEKISGLAYYIVQFEGPIKRGMKEDLTATGATLLHYVSYNAFVVRATTEVIEKAIDLPHVRWAGLFEPAYKLSPRLGKDYDASIEDFMRRSSEDLNAAAERALIERLDPMLAETDRTHSRLFDQQVPSRVISVEISVFEEWNLPLVLDALDKLGARNMIYSHQYSGLIRADIDRVLLGDVSQNPGVMWIDRHIPNVIFNDIARWVVQSGDPVQYATPVHEHGIFGTGQIVTVCDSGIDYEHDAFEDPSVATPGPTHRKVTDYYIPSDASGDDSDQGVNHGTHTSGSVAGDDGTWHVYDGNHNGTGGTYGPHDGQAFDATIQVQDISTDGYFVFPPSDFRDMYQEALDRGSWIHTNSWGSSGASYITDSAQTDDFVWNNQDFLVIYSAGNNGAWEGAMSPMAASKNVIAVGAAYNGLEMEHVAGFSSRGPVNDGRLKPDVMAPGVEVWSAEGGDPEGQTDAYIQLSGTSMAAPTVAGSCALIRQYYMDGWYPTGVADPGSALVPSAALIKATIINSANEMTGDGAYEMGETWYPNNSQGWGRITLDDALFFDGDSRRLMVFDERSGLLTDDAQTYNIAVSDASASFEVTLVWSDYPGTEYSSPNLVNDLDLIVRAPDGTTYLGNQFEGFSPGESMKNPDEHDRLNNVESVLVLSDLETGMWTVEIAAHNVPMGPQPYALVITGGIASDTGVISMDKTYYRSDDTMTIRISDTGLDLDPEAIDTTWALVSSTTELSPENITLTETANSSSLFEAAIALDLNEVPVSGDNLLQVQNLDLLNATYFDEDNGLGESVWIADIATVDDDPPVIFNVTVVNLRSRSCTVLWNTDEPSDSRVTYGTSVPPSESTSSSLITTSHMMHIRRLADNETYYFMVESTDRAGNWAVNDNSSSFYTFTTPMIPPLQPSSEEWPTYQNNVARLGMSPSLISPPLEQIWAVSAGEPGYGGTTVFADGVLVTASRDGRLEAWSAYTGDALWAEQIGDPDSLLGAPTIANGIIYATASESYNGSRIEAFDLYTGELLWFSSLMFNTYVSNLGYSDGVVFGGGMDCVFALDAEDGAVIWAQTAADSIGGVSIAHGMVYVASYYSDHIWALDEYTGDILWDRGLDSAIGPPSVSGDSIYVITPYGNLEAFDAFTGEALWSVGGHGDIMVGTPVCDGSAVYFGSEYNGLYAYDAFTGDMLWGAVPEAYSRNSISLANGYLYSISSLGILSVYDSFDGSHVASYPLDGMGLGPPVISGGWVWVCSYTGDLHAFKGLTPVEILVFPSSQTIAGVPGATVKFDIEVWNAGYLGNDTVDIEISAGAGAWDAALYESDGETPLEDTDGDMIVDTGPLEPNERRAIAVVMTIPEGAEGGDSDTVWLNLTSSLDANVTRVATVTASVPLPGTSIGPSTHVVVEPGETVICEMEVVNEGGMPDVIEIQRSSENDWDTLVFKEDGITPLVDTDGDFAVDVGTLAGLESTTIVVYLIPPDEVLSEYWERTIISAWSSLDPVLNDQAHILVDLTGHVSEEWPTFRYDSSRSGMNPAEYELPLTRKWSYSSGFEEGDVLFSSPVIRDRMVYCADRGGYLTAVDVSTGDEVWSTQLSQEYTYGCPGTPTAAYGNVYLVTPVDYYAACISAVDGKTGELKWSYEVECSSQYQLCTPAVALGTVYWIAGGSSTVYANDAITGELLWSHGPNYGYESLGPSYWSDTVYVNNPYTGLVALDATSGEELWSRYLYSMCAPAIAEGVLYMNDESGCVLAIDPEDGTTIWSVDLGIGYFMEATSPLRVDDMVYTGALSDYNGDTRMYALDASTGAIIWSYESDSSWEDFLSPVYCNGAVYAMSRVGDLYGWNAITGENLLTLSTGYSSYSTPAIGDGYMVFNSRWGNVHAYGFAGTGVGVIATVSPDPLVLTIGEAGFLELTVLDIYDNHVPGQVFEWESTEGLGSVLPITDDGNIACYLAGTEVGTDVVQFASGNLSGFAYVEILPGAEDQLTIDPPSACVSPGEVVHFSAVVADRFGNELDDAEIDWSASESVGDIALDGTLTASTTVGTGTVTACCDDLTASAVVTIAPGELAAVHVSPETASLTVGTALMLEAIGTDEHGNQVDGILMSWACSAGTITPIGIDNATAVFVAPVEPGDCELTVRTGELEASALMDVSAGDLNWIEISPGDIRIQSGQTASLTASWKDAYGNDLDELAMEWASDIGLLTVTNGGLSAEFQAEEPGAGTVTASFGNITASVAVTVLDDTATLSSSDATLLGSVSIAAVAAVIILYMLGRKPGASEPPGPSTSEEEPPPPP